MTIERCPEPVNFKELFKYIPGESAPQKRTYKGKTIFLVDKFPVKNKETLKFNIESTNSRYPQGFRICIYNGYLVIDGEPMEYEKMCNVLLWEDSEVLDVKNIEIQVFTKKGHVFISNIWEETIYQKVVIDGTKPALENEKIIKYPEGKPISCYINSGRWNAGLCNGAAMYSEDIPNGKRYFCNDGVEDDDFDDIVFTVTRKSER
jgi:hypothetical protein